MTTHTLALPEVDLVHDVEGPTDDGRPPLAASGLKLHDRLRAISTSLKRAATKRGSRRS